ncbi:hypothetical protein RFI_04927, partial [Reticulomyxa filosa]
MQDKKRAAFENQSLSEILQKVSPEKADGFVQQLNKLLEEQASQRILCVIGTPFFLNLQTLKIFNLQKKKKKQQQQQQNVCLTSPIKTQICPSKPGYFFFFFYFFYKKKKGKGVGNVKKNKQKKKVCPEDRWTALHACLYKYNQYPPEDTLRIVQLLLDHNADVNQACPEGAVAINVLDKKPLPNGQQNGPENPNREKKTVSFQNKMVLDVAIDFLQAYKWAGCRPSVLQNWKPLIELLDGTSVTQKAKMSNDFDAHFTVPRPKVQEVDGGYCAKFQR